MSDVNNDVESFEGVSDDTDLDQFSSDFFGEKKEEAAPAKAAADEVKEDDAKENTHVEADALAEEAPKEEGQDEPDPKPKRNRSQERIEDLNAKYRQEQREKEDLQRQLDELKSGQQNKESKTPTPVVTDGPTPEDVTEDGTEKYPLGEFDPNYIRDLTRFTIQQERAEDRKAAEVEAQKSKVEQAQTALVTEWNTKIPLAQEKYEDFMDKAQDFVEEFDYLEPAYSDYLTDTIMGMEFGTDVLYYLANNPEEAHKIVEGGVRKATIALGRLESQFASKQEPEPRLVSNAPPPPPANKGLATARTAVAPDTDNLADFEKVFFKKRG